MYINQVSSLSPIKPQPAGNENEILLWGNSNLFKCERSDVKYLGAGALHRHNIRGNHESDARKHFYYGKCRIDFKDEAKRQGHIMQGSEHVVYRV